jgi:hypothetical protein
MDACQSMALSHTIKQVGGVPARVVRRVSRKHMVEANLTRKG